MGQTKVAAGLAREQPVTLAQRSEAIVEATNQANEEPEQVFKQFMCSTKYLIAAMFHDACSGLDRYIQHHHQLRSDTKSR